MNVHVSLINGSVSFSHPHGLTLAPLVRELGDAGFEVLQNLGSEGCQSDGTHAGHPHRAFAPPWQSFASLFKPSGRRERAHREHCQACQDEKASEKGKGPVSPVYLELLHGSASGDAQSTKAVFTVHGMTCRYATKSYRCGP